MLYDLTSTEYSLRASLLFLENVSRSRKLKVLFVGNPNITDSFIYRNKKLTTPPVYFDFAEKSVLSGKDTVLLENPFLWRWAPGFFLNIRDITNSKNKTKFRDKIRANFRTTGLVLRNTNLNKRLSHSTYGRWRSVRRYDLGFYRRPDIVIFLGTSNSSKFGVLECNKLEIPTVGLVSTDALGLKLSYGIHSSDSSIQLQRYYFMLFYNSLKRGYSNLLYRQAVLFSKDSKNVPYNLELARSYRSVLIRCSKLLNSIEHIFWRNTRNLLHGSKLFHYRISWKLKASKYHAVSLSSMLNEHRYTRYFNKPNEIDYERYIRLPLNQHLNFFKLYNVKLSYPLFFDQLSCQVILRSSSKTRHKTNTILPSLFNVNRLFQRFCLSLGFTRKYSVQSRPSLQIRAKQLFGSFCITRVAGMRRRSAKRFHTKLNAYNRLFWYKLIYRSPRRRRKGRRRKRRALSTLVYDRLKGWKFSVASFLHVSNFLSAKWNVSKSSVFRSLLKLIPLVTMRYRRFRKDVFRRKTRRRSRRVIMRSIKRKNLLLMRISLVILRLIRFSKIFFRNKEYFLKKNQAYFLYFLIWLCYELSIRKFTLKRIFILFKSFTFICIDTKSRPLYIGKDAGLLRRLNLSFSRRLLLLAGYNFTKGYAALKKWFPSRHRRRPNFLINPISLFIRSIPKRILASKQLFSRLKLPRKYPKFRQKTIFPITKKLGHRELKIKRIFTWYRLRQFYNTIHELKWYFRRPRRLPDFKKRKNLVTGRPYKRNSRINVLFRSHRMKKSRSRRRIRRGLRRDKITNNKLNMVRWFCTRVIVRKTIPSLRRFLRSSEVRARERSNKSRIFKILNISSRCSRSSLFKKRIRFLDDNSEGHNANFYRYMLPAYPRLVSSYYKYNAEKFNDLPTEVPEPGLIYSSTHAIIGRLIRKNFRGRRRYRNPFFSNLSEAIRPMHFKYDERAFDSFTRRDKRRSVLALRRFSKVFYVDLLKQMRRQQLFGTNLFKKIVGFGREVYRANYLVILNTIAHPLVLNFSEFKVNLSGPLRISSPQNPKAVTKLSRKFLLQGISPTRYPKRLKELIRGFKKIHRRLRPKRLRFYKRRRKFIQFGFSRLDPFTPSWRNYVTPLLRRSVFSKRLRRFRKKKSLQSFANSSLPFLYSFKSLGFKLFSLHTAFQYFFIILESRLSLFPILPLYTSVCEHFISKLFSIGKFLIPLCTVPLTRTLYVLCAEGLYNIGPDKLIVYDYDLEFRSRFKRPVRNYKLERRYPKRYLIAKARQSFYTRAKKIRLFTKLRFMEYFIEARTLVIDNFMFYKYKKPKKHTIINFKLRLLQKSKFKSRAEARLYFISRVRGSKYLVALHRAIFRSHKRNFKKYWRSLSLVHHSNN